MNQLTAVIEDFRLDCEARNLSAHTLRYYADAFKPFLAFMESQGVTQLERVTTPLLRAYVAFCLEEVSPGGAHARLRPVRRLMNWCVQEDYLEIDPMRRVKMPKVPDPDVSVIRPHDVRKLLETVQKSSHHPLRDRALIEILFNTGMRASEVVGLKLEHISPGTLLVVHGKGGRTREVPVARDVAKSLRLYITKERHETYLDEVFLSSEETPMTVDALKQMIRRMSDAAGLGYRFSPHSFRRGFVVEWVKRGGSEFAAQRILGHTTQAMTSRYARFNGDDLKAVHTRVGAARSLRR